MLGQLTLSWQTHPHILIHVNQKQSYKLFINEQYPSVGLKFLLTLLQLSDRLFQHLYTCVASLLTGLQVFYLLAETMHLCLGLILQSHNQGEKDVYVLFIHMFIVLVTHCVVCDPSFVCAYIDYSFVHGDNGHFQNEKTFVW